MSSRFLPIVIKNAIFALPRVVQVIQRQATPLHRALDFCTEYRRRGIAELLLNARADVFLQNLQCSGTAFAFYLAQTADENKTASKCLPLFDAIASGDDATAKRISQLAATDWHKDDEYEDDFLYAHLLMGKFYLMTPHDQLVAMLTRYQALLDGADDPRFVIIKALVLGDDSEFAAGLETLLAARRDDYASGIDADQIDEEEASTEGKVFVEGIALVKLAMRMQLKTQRRYLFIPSAALTASAPSFDTALWSTPLAAALSSG
jgi:hypothetical protein